VLRDFRAVRQIMGLMIILVFPVMQQGIAQEFTDGTVPTAQWQAPKSENAKVVKKESDEPARVRIGLRLTPFKKVTTRNKDATTSSRFIPIEPIRHTLRARLNKPNHFFIGEWHIETKPVTWIKKTRKYQVQLSVHRRFGAFGQLEDFVGNVTLDGVLDEGENNVHVLLGVARQRLRDKFGHPVLDVVAGFAPGAQTKGSISAKDHLSGRAASPAVPPTNYSGSLIRGRF
jgi:hypothetical protein